MDGYQGSMNGQTDTAEVEVVKHDGKVIVKSSGGNKVHLQTSLGHILDGGMLFHAHTILAIPQLHLEHKFCISQSFLNFGGIKNYVNSIVNDVIQGDFFISVQDLKCF